MILYRGGGCAVQALLAADPPDLDEQEARVHETWRGGRPVAAAGIVSPADEDRP